MDTTPETRKIEIDHETLNHLNTTRKWTMFLAVLGFIFLGFLIIFSIITGTFLTAFNRGEAGPGIPELLIIILLLVMVLVYFFPVMFLFRFSKHAAAAVQTLDKLELQKAFRNLKSYFVYLGILIIIVLSFYVVALIVAGSSMAFLKGIR